MVSDKRWKDPMEKAGLFAVMCLLLAGCVRGPLDRVCPALTAGDLLLTEVRGNQSGLDTWGQWIELFNPTPVPLEAGGLVVRIWNQTPNGCSKPSTNCACSCDSAIDENCQGFCQCTEDMDCGTSEYCQAGACNDYGEVTLLDSGLVVAPGGYLAVGRFPDYDRPDHVDFGWEAQFTSNLYDHARMELWTCDTQGNEVLVDQVTWEDLPSAGTWSFDGTTWCINDEDPGYTGDLAIGLPGTPGEANPQCN